MSRTNGDQTNGCRLCLLLHNQVVCTQWHLPVSSSFAAPGSIGSIVTSSELLFIAQQFCVPPWFLHCIYGILFAIFWNLIFLFLLQCPLKIKNSSYRWLTLHYLQKQTSHLRCIIAFPTPNPPFCLLISFHSCPSLVVLWLLIVGFSGSLIAGYFSSVTFGSSVFFLMFLWMVACDSSVACGFLFISWWLLGWQESWWRKSMNDVMSCEFRQISYEMWSIQVRLHWCLVDLENYIHRF